MNLDFEKLRNILEEKQELRQFRLFSRAGLLEAAVHHLETKNLETKLSCNGAALPKPNLKRERFEDEVISPNKIPKPYFTNQFPLIPNLNNSTGFESPDSVSPPTDRFQSMTYSQQNHFYSLELARAQLIAYNRLIIPKNATQMAQRESRYESAGVWRPW